MSEDIIRCHECSFKCVKSQVYKTWGYCPRCLAKGKAVLVSKAVNEDTGSVTPQEALSKYASKYSNN